MPSHTSVTLRTYWITWSVLLALTVVMVVLDQAPMPRSVVILVVLGTMATKATLIAGTFMHLRFERIALVLMIVVGLMLNGAILFGLIVPDAIRIMEMRQ